MYESVIYNPCRVRKVFRSAYCKCIVNMDVHITVNNVHAPKCTCKIVPSIDVSGLIICLCVMMISLN